MEDQHRVSLEKQPHESGPGPVAILRVVIAQASFIAALMFYLGALYASRYYNYFHLSPFSLGFGFAEFVLQSLHLLKLPVLVTFVVLLIVSGIPRLPKRLPLPDRVARSIYAPISALARGHLVVVAAGLVMLILWPLIQPYGWVAPLTIAVGLLLGQSKNAQGSRVKGLRGRAVPLFAAGVFLFWAVTLAAWDVGERDAKLHAGNVLHWTSVVVLSTESLSLPTGSIVKQDLGEGLRHRYRYTGLRLLIERNGRYYVVPVNWNAKTDSIWVIRESENTWIGLMPGVQ